MASQGNETVCGRVDMINIAHKLSLVGSGPTIQ